jgi:hypothetical protein
MANKNLFSKKKATAKKATAKKDDKVIVKIEGAEFDEKLVRFNELKKKIANETAEMKSLDGDIKGEGVEKFIELYAKGKRNPGSFKLASDSGSKIMVIAMDKYLKVDEERSEELQEAWGEDVVTENTTYAFNGGLLEKYQEQISEMIMNAEFMSDEEKEDLIVANTTYAVQKGAINDAMTTGKGKIEDFLGDLQPILALKQTA